MRGRRGLILGFLAAIAAAAGLAGHAVWTVLVVAQEAAPVESWMTPGLIDKTYGIGLFDLAAILNLDPDAVDGRTLAEIAEVQGVPVDALVAKLQREIAAQGVNE